MTDKKTNMRDHHYRTAAEADEAMRSRLQKSRERNHYLIPKKYIKPIKKLLREGASKKKICILFNVSYEQLKQQLKEDE